jgi:hypothetical protein
MANGTTPDLGTPVVIDLGKARKRNIRKLKRGRGKLYDETQDVIDDIRAGLGPQADGKEVLPVIVVYQRKRRKRRNRGGGSLFPFWF